MKQEIKIALARPCGKALCLTCEFKNEDNCEPSIIADYLYNAGYRKQSEWISVDERMPEDDLPKETDRRTIRCLVATNKGTVKACVRQRYISPSNGKLTPWCWSKDVYAKPTHWMPLPEPPKKKGGAE